MSKEKSDIFCILTMKCTFSHKIGRSDTEPRVGFSSTCTNVLTNKDWNKSVQLLGFVFAAHNDILVLEASNSCTLNWYINVPYSVHTDMKSYVESIFSIAKVSIASSSTK